MAIKNVELELYARICDLLAADAGFAGMVPTGNFVRFDAVEGDENPDNGEMNDGEYNRAELETVSGKTNLYSDDETFGTLDHVADWQEDHQYVFRLTLITKTLAQNEGSLLSCYAMNAIRQGGPRLGLPYVYEATIDFVSRREQSNDTGDIRRIKTEMNINVKAKLDGTSLTGE